MRFLLDVCVSSRSLQSFLVGRHHDVVSVVSIDPTASDKRLLALALEEDRVLVTEDKDFGELVFVGRLPHGPIIRLVGLSVDQQVDAMAEMLERYLADLAEPVIVTATRSRIRIRR